MKIEDKLDEFEEIGLQKINDIVILKFGNDEEILGYFKEPTEDQIRKLLYKKTAPIWKCDNKEEKEFHDHYFKRENYYLARSDVLAMKKTDGVYFYRLIGSVKNKFKNWSDYKDKLDEIELEITTPSDDCQYMFYWDTSYEKGSYLNCKRLGF